MKHVSPPLEWAKHITLEPGDGTHYEFLVAQSPEKEAVFIAAISRGSGCPRFDGYTYWKEDLLRFDARNPGIAGAPYASYRAAASDLRDGFLDYVREHSAENPWTALAGILAGIEALR